MPDWLAISIGVCAFGISLGTFISNFIHRGQDVKRMKQERFDEIMKEYRGKQMHESIYVLNKGVSEKMNSPQYRKYFDPPQKGKEVDLHERQIGQGAFWIELCSPGGDFDYRRRYVSHFFRTLAGFYYENRVLPEDVKAIWGPENVVIIGRIIIPCEENLIKIREKQSTASKNTIKYLKDFHNEFNPDKLIK
jgi:hypothetical protein